MKLKFKGARHFVLLLKEPEFFLRSIAPDEVIEVSEMVGFAILTKFGKDFERLEVEQKRRKVVEEIETK